MQTVTLHRTRETRGTVVYDAPESNANPLIRTVYLAKTALAGARPEKIEITVSGEGV